MNPRELIARLNVPAVRYEIGRGGIPELTNIDIAGALGMIQDRFARDVFAAIWWPDGEVVDREQVAATVISRIMIEFGRRQKALTVARLELHIAECELAGKRNITKFDRATVDNCRLTVERCRRQCWPWNVDVYVKLYPAAVYEIRNPRICPGCAGRGEVLKGALKKTCEMCLGTGRKDEMKKDRAMLIGVDKTSYSRVWMNVYQWVFSMVRDAETTGADALARALARPDAEAA